MKLRCVKLKLSESNVKKPFVRQPLESLKWLNMNVKSTRGKKEPELQLKLKRKEEKCLNRENNQVQSMFREAILTISLQVPTNKYTIKHNTQREV